MHAPISDPGGVPSRWPWRGQDCCLPVAATVGFGSGCPVLSSDHHYTFFGIQFRGLRPRLASASHTVSRRSHFGSATDPVASLWSGGIDRLTPTHPLGNNDEFQGVSPLFQRPELVSARAAPCYAAGVGASNSILTSLVARLNCHLVRSG